MNKEFNKVEWKHISIWKDVPPEKWYDYKWQLSNTIKDIETLKKLLLLIIKRKKI